MEYTGPAALNEGIKAIGEAFTSRPAISLQDLMQRKQLEQAMKPITLDELKAKTPPDLYEPMMKLAGSNGLIENVNGIQFIRQHNVKDFHKTLSENKVWQQMILDDSIKNSNALIEQRLPELEQRKAKHEARLRYWDDQRKKAMATTDAKGNQMAPNMKAIDSIDREMAEYQQGDEYKQMMSLEKQLMGIKELQKRRLQSFGINEDGFKKDTETYGSDEALKISMYGSDYRRQLDRQLKEEKLQDAITLETAKAGLKPEGNLTTEQLTARALRGDKEAAAILKKMHDDKLELARAQGGIKQEQENAGIDIPLIAEAVANGQDSRVAIKNTRGNNVATKVESEVLKKYPKFNFTMADANYKWKSSQTNMRTINFAQGSMQRVAALYQQVAQLPNASIPAINKIMREISVNLGKPEYTNFESNRNAIVQEVNTALSGSATGSDLRVQIELENLKSARSPKQLQGAITNLYDALFARLDVDLSPIYPIEVVRGEKSMAQYKKDLYKQYRNNYTPNHGSSSSSLEPFDKTLPVKTKDGRDVKTLSDTELLKLLNGE